MATPKLSEARMREAVALVEECLLEGYRPKGHTGSGPGALAMAAKRAVERGVAATPNGFAKRIEICDRDGFKVDWSKWRQPQELVRYAYIDTAGERVDPPQTVYAPDAEPQRVLVIGDSHADPRQDLRRFTWLGRLMADTRPPHVIQIGDFGSWDSVSAHEAKGSKGYAQRPSFEQDYNANEEALRRILKERPKDYKPRLDVAMGNHEDRICRYENLNPELGNTLSIRVDELFARYGWRTREFGAYRYVGGVAFTHAPLNGVGRAYGGKTGSMRAGNDSNVTLVHGHDHKRTITTIPRIGGTGKVDVVSVGCALEWGWTEPYAKLSPNGWWWGVCEMLVADGMILDLNWTSMLTLRDRYSDEGGDVKS